MGNLVDVDAVVSAAVAAVAAELDGFSAGLDCFTIDAGAGSDSAMSDVTVAGVGSTAGGSECGSLLFG